MKRTCVVDGWAVLLNWPWMEEPDLWAGRVFGTRRWAIRAWNVGAAGGWAKLRRKGIVRAVRVKATFEYDEPDTD